MRCYICDDIIEKPVYNGDHKDYDPCVKCLDIIHHVFEDIPDPKPEEDEDEDTNLLDNLEEQVYNIS